MTLISRADAIRWVKTECNPYGKPTLDYDSGLKVIEHLKKMPSALPLAEAITQKDCTKFLLWLLEEIMDEENWEMNAVANGEIIARKLTNLGLLEVKEGYYVRTSLTYGLQREERESLVDKIKNWRHR